MIQSEQLDLGDVKVTVRELTVGEIRRWWNDAEAGQADEADPVAWLLAGDDAMPLDELRRMCDLSAEDAERLSQAELSKLEATCAKLNPRFFAVRSKVTAMATAATGLAGAAGTSTATSSGSSSADTPA